MSYETERINELEARLEATEERLSRAFQKLEELTELMEKMQLFLARKQREMPQGKQGEMPQGGQALPERVWQTELKKRSASKVLASLDRIVALQKYRIEKIY